MPAVDASLLLANLFQGGAPAVGSRVRRAGFDTLVLAAEEYQPAAELFPGVRVMHVPLDDAKPSPEELAMIRKAGWLVAKEVQAGRRVLVTCMAGRNRSGIINAVALRWLTGRSPDAIVAHIRDKRMASALSNPYFVRALKQGHLEPRPRQGVRDVRQSIRR